MITFEQTFRNIQSSFERDFTKAALKTLIVLWSLVIVAIALSIDNKFVLAGILAYEILP